MQKIVTFLWFKDSAEEAMNFYTSVFKNSKIINAQRIPDGSVMMGTLQIEGQEFYVLNGNPHFKFTEAISMFVKCEDQAEVDYLWKKLTSDGGQESMCGWLKDKFGLSWQIIPNALMRMMGDKDPVKAKRVMDSMLKMNKIEVSKLEDAYEGK